MWPDNETSVDLLGFAHHKDLIKGIVTNQALLPVTVGVFGDWGGGKSSVLRMLREDLENDESIACLSFNGWMFEGYDDAKAALISSVLLQLGDHKRFGPALRDGVAGLLKKVNLMRLLGLAISKGLPLAGGLAASQLGVPVDVVAAGAFATATATTSPVDPQSPEPEQTGENDWQALIASKAAPTILDLRSFRNDFEKLLSETDLKCVVILIDDLDRCEPERLIENLEAIKLFLAVPKTAFVIAADERIVRHAVSRRYEAPSIRAQQTAGDEPYDLVTDYVEKLIQIPYHLPRLSPSEVETFVTLLFCSLSLTKEDYAKVRANCEELRARNLYTTYGAGAIREVIPELPDALSQSLQWTGRIAPAFTEGLKGNPRQVKRFLNALLLRRQLAGIAGLDIKDDVLVKLMLLEYMRKNLFDQLYQWQATSEGQPEQLAALEARALSDSTSAAGRVNLEENDVAAWAEPAATSWLRLEPRLEGIDLRDYFWIARDRLASHVTNLAMLSPYLRRLIESLMREAERAAAVSEVSSLKPDEISEVLQLLIQQVSRDAQGRIGIDSLIALTRGSVVGAASALTTALLTRTPESLDPDIAYEVSTLRAEGKLDAEEASRILKSWADTATRIGAAAKDALGTH